MGNKADKAKDIIKATVKVAGAVATVGGAIIAVLKDSKK